MEKCVGNNLCINLVPNPFLGVMVLSGTLYFSAIFSVVLHSYTPFMRLKSIWPQCDGDVAWCQILLMTIKLVYTMVKCPIKVILIISLYADTIFAMQIRDKDEFLSMSSS